VTIDEQIRDVGYRLGQSGSDTDASVRDLPVRADDLPIKLGNIRIFFDSI